MAVHAGQFGRIFRRFDAFRHHLHVECARHGDDGAQQNVALVAGIGHQRLVELDRVEGEAGEVGE
ncbi:hypothetical protein D3C72_878410 [compost metagenome]